MLAAQAPEVTLVDIVGNLVDAGGATRRASAPVTSFAARGEAEPC
jgi:hypothetical protein